MQKNTIISIIISLVLIGGTLYVMSNKSTSSDAKNSVSQSQNVEIRNGVQYVTITARGGYSPRTSVVEPNIPTKLIIKTNGTYDCSASLVIRNVNFQKILQPTGEEVIDLGTIKKGSKVQGVCGMGMYNFQIKTS
jgi:plastocyanin domain-containing protein